MRCYHLTDFIGAATLIELLGNPVFEALQEQLVDEETAVNLVPLWVAA